MRVQAFKWGLIPSWAKDRKIGSKMINARSETLPEKPAFKDPKRIPKRRTEGHHLADDRIRIQDVEEA